MEGFGGSLINVFTLSKPIWKDYAEVVPESPWFPFLSSEQQISPVPLSRAALWSALHI